MKSPSHTSLNVEGGGWSNQVTSLWRFFFQVLSAGGREIWSLKNLLDASVSLELGAAGSKISWLENIFEVFFLTVFTRFLKTVRECQAAVLIWDTFSFWLVIGAVCTRAQISPIILTLRRELQDWHLLCFHVNDYRNKENLAVMTKEMYPMTTHLTEISYHVNFQYNIWSMVKFIRIWWSLELGKTEDIFTGFNLIDIVLTESHFPFVLSIFLVYLSSGNPPNITAKPLRC